MTSNAAPTSGPLKEALVSALRANSPIKTAAVGGFHEGYKNESEIDFSKTFVTYQLVDAPIFRTWGSATLAALFDIVVNGTDPVKVNSLDTLITELLDGSSLSVTGLTTLIVQREEELPLPPEPTAEGKKVYRNGATYSVWVDKNFDNPPTP
jgi:hypothetical protein